MSYIDYGAIAFKNGKLISTEMFTPMEDTCGFSDKKQLLPHTKVSFDDNYFIVIGNKKLIFGFYETCISWWHDRFPDKKNTKMRYRYDIDDEFFDSSDYVKWKKWERTFYNGSDQTDLVVKHKNRYYVAKFKLNGDNYKVYFGFGVDLDFYKKTRRVNYYRSPEYLIKSLTEKLIYKLKALIKRKA